MGKPTLKALSGLIILLTAFAVAGCGKDASVTKTDEERFKNPAKEMPPEAANAMKNAKPPEGGYKPAGPR